MLQDKQRYYLMGLIPLGVVTIGLLSFGCDLVNILLFFISYLWVFVLELPRMQSVLANRKYCFSFLNIIVQGNNILREKLASSFPKTEFLSRSIIPLSFFCLLVYSSGVGNILFVFTALVLRELTRQKQWKPF